tara:strand:+ start:1061 stop:1321 length:261 start_codon:yes stop_codon:yes gene_type:complete
MQDKMFKKGDLVSIRDTSPRDSLYEELGVFSKMRLDGTVGIVLEWAGKDAKHELDMKKSCYKVLVNNKIELVHTKYMKNADNIIFG